MAALLREPERRIVESVGTEVYTEQSLSESFEEDSVIAFTVKDGAKWTMSLPALHDMILGKESTFLIEENGELILKGEGRLYIKGTLTNKSKFTNNSNIYNDSANTLDNQGTLTNNGIINNASTGKITNTGTIDNTNGTINNEGTFLSDQTKEQMGGNFEGNPPSSDSGNNSGSSGGSSGGGCNAGFGMFGLLLAGLAILKHRKI